MKSILFSIACFLALVSASFAGQIEIDSLRQVVYRTDGAKKVDALIELAGRVGISDVAESELLAKQALQEAQGAKYDHGIIKSWLRLASIASRKSDYAFAEDLAGKALHLAIKEQDRKEQANAQLTLGSIYVMRGEYAKAFESHLVGLSNAEAVDDRYLIRTFLMNIGIIKDRLGELDEAEAYQLKALKIYDEDGLMDQAGSVYVNLAVVAYKRDNYGISMEYNQKALDIFTKVNDKYAIGLCLYNLGFGCELLDRDKEAMDYFDRSLEVREEIQDRTGIAKVLLQKAKLLKKQRKDVDAVQLAKESLVIAEEIKNWLLIKDIYEVLYQWSKQKGDIEKAFEYYSQFVDAKDTLIQRSNKDRMAELEAKYKFDELQSQNAIQAHEAEIAALKLRQRNLLTIGLVVILLLLSILFVGVYRRTRTKLDESRLGQLSAEKETESLTLELKEERRRLKVFTNQMIARNEGEVENDSDEENQENDENGLNLIKGKLNEGILNDQDWVAFNVLFEAAYPDFGKNLTEHLGDSTINHQRLAALIKIQLSNKEIATVFHISRDSVVRAKYRLRQKLGLDSNQEMENLLKNL